LEERLAAELKSEERWREQRPPVAQHRVEELAVVCCDHHLIAAVGRGHADLTGRDRPGNQNRQQRRAVASHAGALHGEDGIFAGLPAPSRGYVVAKVTWTCALLLLAGCAHRSAVPTRTQ